jgi:acyl-coenzyme A thioesterase PaaI-like protein
VRSIDVFRAVVAGELDPPPVAQLVGMRMTEVEPGRVVFELDAGPQHASPLGTVHGGIMCDLADAALGCSHASLLEAGRRSPRSS